MAEGNHGLTDADRKAIADIRRELEAEFGPVEAPTPLAADDEPRAARDKFVLPRVVDDSRERPWSARAGVIAAFVAGLLIGAVLGAVAIITFLSQQQDAPAARSAPAPSPSDPVAASLREAVDEWINATRRGEVPQELRWKRTGTRWLIVGERDARVIAAE